MKLFTCKEGEAIVIDQEIIVQIAEIGDDEVFLEIDGAADEQVCLGENLDAVI